MKKICLALSLGFALTVLSAALAFSADGKTLYAKCAGCHGADGSKAALGVSKPLKGMKADAFAKAMAGYKAKTYGGAKKNVMEPLAAGLSDADVKALGDFVSKL